MLCKVLTLLELMFSDGVGGRLKALASTKLRVEMANRQSSNRVRAAYTLHVGFEVPRNSQVGCVAQPRTQWVVFYYGIYSPKLITAVSFVPPQSNGSHPSRT